MPAARLYTAFGETKNARKTHCPRGHLYSDKKNKRGSRICRECKLLLYAEKHKDDIPTLKPTHCHRGHAWTLENIGWNDVARTIRFCITCKRMRMAGEV
jgi:CxxC motif-containing protein